MSFTRINADGTMANQFRIGKAGPTILQGTSAPDNNVGLSGDIYVEVSNTPRLYMKQSIGWYPSGDSTFGFTPQTCSDTTNTLNVITTYAGVSVGAPTTVTLMTGTDGKTVVVKDESGTAASNTITVVGQEGDLIDGQASWNIDVDHGAMTLVYNNAGWHIVSAMT